MCIRDRAGTDQRLKDKEEMLRRCRLDQVDMQFEDRKASFLSDCKEMENCFAMLVQRFPAVKDTNNDVDDDDEDDDKEQNEPIGNQAGTFILTLDIFLQNQPLRITILFSTKPIETQDTLLCFFKRVFVLMF